MESYDSETAGIDQSAISNEASDEEWYVSDLQLAAELGKTLLERNQELEVTLKQQQAVIEEQSQEIQFLSRQSAALKEVNDSRLRIYEQLEVSVTDLEKTNQKLQSESNADKKKIKRLTDSVETLENKCEELQDIVDELQTLERSRRRDSNRAGVDIAQWSRRFITDNGSFEDTEELDVVNLRSSVSRLTSQLSKEHRKSEELEAQVTLMAEENLNLTEQVTLLQEQQERLVFFHQAERLYWACHKKDCESEDDSAMTTEFEPGDEPSVGPCALVQLRNGAVAYGSQESLASVGLVMDNHEALDSKISQRNCISLLSELDAQYRAVIEKYEELLQARRQQLGDYYEDGDHSLNSINSGSSSQSNTSRCLLEGLSEASDLSSGFSDSSDRSFTDQSVQTDRLEESPAKENPVLSHFKSSPEYKQLFQDIFDILKRPATVSQVPPLTLEVMDIKSAKKKRPRFKKHDIPFNCRSSKPMLCVSPQTVMGYPVFKLPGAMSYAEVLEKGGTRGKPWYKP